MKPDILPVFTEGNKTATIYSRGKDGFRVVLYDIYTEQTSEEFFKIESEAEDYAEGWVLQ
jgi:hypothetical protein